MKIVYFIAIVCLFCNMDCREPLIQDVITNPADHNMKFIPAYPVINDEIKLIVYDDCTYNNLSEINQNGNTIDIQKQFNSLMKLPCFIRNDTIIIGKLPEGTYTIHYKLVDLAQVPSKIALSLTFILYVSR